MAKQRILDTGNTIALERPSVSVPRNTFNLSHPVKFSGNMGNLYPFMMEECIPGDTFHVNASLVTRLQPMLAPMYQHVKVRIEFFNVDNILLWPNAYQFFSPLVEGVAPPAAPFLNEPMGKNDLADYLGICNTQGANAKVSALPFAAYQKVVSDWYRDEDLQEGGRQFIPLVDGDNGANFTDLNAIWFRNNDRDYFRSAKPWAQKGNPMVIPIVGSSVAGLPISAVPGNAALLKDKVTGFASPTGPVTSVGGTLTAGVDAYLDPNGSMIISAADAIDFAGTINDLRAAEALQRFLEADAIGGTRYPEQIKTQFGVSTDDRRMFRAEYLGSFSSDISISEVLNTTGTADAPQGTMAGHGYSMSRHIDGIHHTCKEHGWLVGMVSVIPCDTAYYFGLPKKFLRFDRLDYLWPLLAELGSQTIQNKELGFTGSFTDDDPWGFVPRYTDYRMAYGKICGDFKDSLDFWQLDNKLGDPTIPLPVTPPLATEFLECRPTADLMRPFAVIDPTVHHLLFYFGMQITVNRALPRLAVPGIS